MKRVALLPAGSDPFLLAYWLRHYATWADEVDELRITVVGQHNPVVLDYMAACAAKVPHARIIEAIPQRTDHGWTLRRMLDMSADAEHVLLLEDDAFVRRPGVVDERFGRIERGAVDVIGTARDNTDPPLIARCKELWGEPWIGPSGESGYTLYPCFVFARRSDLYRTDGNFGAAGWRTGEPIPGLGIAAFDWMTTDGRPQERMSGDTFTSAGWQLRSLGLRVEGESAYRSDAAHTMAAAQDAPWFHVGSLSTGVGCLFLPEVGSGTDPNLVALIRVPGEIRDWHKRMAWWTRVWEKWDGGIPGYHAEYGAALHQAMEDVGAEPDAIAFWRANYDPLVTWPEI